ncbi:MAG: hypothetical protein K5876_05450 [Ruminiclostridium sp.]|nr:hypothetical protein [Ruminiclostridium sp.]
MSEKLQEIIFDNSPEEIEEAYKEFHNRYTLRRKLIYTVIYLIVVVLAADLVIKNPTNPAGYIAGGLGLGILVFNWVKPVLIRRKMMQGLRELGTDETYHIRLYEDRIEIETEIRPADAETEIVAVTAQGVIPVEEGSDAAKELAEHPELVKDDTQIEKTVYRLAETEILLCDHKELLLMFVNRSYIHAIPKRCFSGEKEILDFKAYFEEKGLM